jgi:hypothetical protein
MIVVALSMGAAGGSATPALRLGEERSCDFQLSLVPRAIGSQMVG